MTIVLKLHLDFYYDTSLFFDAPSSIGGAARKLLIICNRCIITLLFFNYNVILHTARPFMSCLQYQAHEYYVSS